MSVAATNAGPPSFAHLDFGDRSFAKWAQHMESRATMLSEVLYKTRQTWGFCVVCQCDFPLNMVSHITGRKHGKELFTKLNYCDPPSRSVLETFTQYWKLDHGQCPYYRFNHVTGDQGYAVAPPGEHVEGPSAETEVRAVRAVSPAPVSRTERLHALADDRALGHTAVRGESQPSEATSPPASVSGAYQVPDSRYGSSSLPLPASVSEAPDSRHGRSSLPGPASVPGTPQAPDTRYRDAMSDKISWRSFISGPASELAEVLLNLTGSHEGHCAVCSLEMRRGAVDHLGSQNHWRNLWSRFQQLPGVEDANNFERPWVQHFPTSQGTYLFNHLTGQQKWSTGNPAVHALPPALSPALPPISPAALQKPTPPSPRSSVQNPTAPSPRSSLQKQTPPLPRSSAHEEDPLYLADPWASGKSKGPPVKAVPVKVPPAVVKAAPALPKPPGIASPPEPLVERDAAHQPSLTELMQAIDDRYAWKSFMEPAAQRLEAALQRNQTFRCPMCDCDVESASQHLPSYDHWHRLWEKLGKKPPPPDSYDWNKPWVQTFAIAGGSLQFNHVTGVVRTTAAEETPRAPDTPAADTFDLSLWVWGQHIERHARSLCECLKGLGQLDAHCIVCDSRVSEVVPHLMSRRHYDKLKSKIDGIGHGNLEEGPWVQVFSDSLRFNHVTGAIENGQVFQ